MPARVYKPLKFDEFPLIEPGDQLVITPECGLPEIDKDTEVVVAAVSGHSFLTTDGLGIGACFATGAVFATGVHHDMFEMSELACDILAGMDKFS